MSLRTFCKLLVSLSLFACTSVFAVPLTVDIAGMRSNGLIGDANNTVLTYQIGAGATITTIDYAVDLTAFTPSWLSELRLALTDSAETAGVYLTPGVGNINPGSGAYAGSFDLVALGLDFSVGADGILRLEFFENYNDPDVAPDGIWNAGTITVGVQQAPASAVPEPSSALLAGAGLAMAALAGHARRRRGPGQGRIRAYAAPCRRC